MDKTAFLVNVEGMVFDGDRYLMAMRSMEEEHAPGTLAFPGGCVEHWPMDEVLEETVRREIREEVDVEVGECLYVESHSFGAASPCVDIVFLCRYLTGIARAVDPAEVSDVVWMTFDEAMADPRTPPWIQKSLEKAEGLRRSTATSLGHG